MKKVTYQRRSSCCITYHGCVSADVHACKAGYWLWVSYWIPSWGM